VTSRRQATSGSEDLSRDGGRSRAIPLQAHSSEQPVSVGLKVIVLAGGPAISLATSLIQPVLPSIEADLARGPDDAFLVKMLVGVMGIAMVIGASLTGFLVDRFGLKRIMAGNYALYAIGGTAGVYLNDLHLLIASRFLLGIAAAGAVTGSIIIINARMGLAHRATWLGYYNGVAQMSSVVLNPVSGVLGELNWHWSFAIYGLAAPFALLAALTLPDKPPAMKDLVATPSPSLIRWFPFRFALLGLVLGTIIYIPAVHLPFLLHKLGMTNPALISLVLTGDIIAGSIASLLYGRARRVLSEYSAFTISVTLTGLGLLVAALAPSVTIVVIGSILFGLGVAWFLPTLMIVVANRVAPDQQGQAAGLVKGANYLGAPIAVALTEPITRAHGPAGAILVASILSLALSIVGAAKLLRLRQRRP
jgi:MFS family permease